MNLYLWVRESKTRTVLAIIILVILIPFGILLTFATAGSFLFFVVLFTMASVKTIRLGVQSAKLKMSKKKNEEAAEAVLDLTEESSEPVEWGDVDPKDVNL